VLPSLTLHPDTATLKTTHSDAGNVNFLFIYFCQIMRDGARNKRFGNPNKSKPAIMLNTPDRCMTWIMCRVPNLAAILCGRNLSRSTQTATAASGQDTHVIHRKYPAPPVA
jgi:hypothetical protein